MADDFAEEGYVRARSELRFFIEKGNNSQPTFDSVDTRLIIREVNERPLDALANILVLLQLEDVRIELNEYQ